MSRPPPINDNDEEYARYLQQAVKLRELAEKQPVGMLRNRLLALSNEFQMLADSMTVPRR
jgi:hypothetical protein